MNYISIFLLLYCHLRILSESADLRNHRKEHFLSQNNSIDFSTFLIAGSGLKDSVTNRTLSSLKLRLQSL